MMSLSPWCNLLKGTPYFSKILGWMRQVLWRMKLLQNDETWGNNSLHVFSNKWPCSGGTQYQVLPALQRKEKEHLKNRISLEKFVCPYSVCPFHPCPILSQKMSQKQVTLATILLGEAQAKLSYVHKILKPHFRVSSPSQSRSQAVVCVSTPRKYLRSGYFLV